jgi:hypothetical protein
MPRKVARVLLGCGIAYPVAYAVANDVVAASRYPGYRRMDQAISELSAIGAPTRRFLTAMLPVFTVLQVAYGIGVWNCGQGRRSLRAVAGVLVAGGITTVAWLPYPMSSRQDIAAGRGAANDVGHLVLSGITITETLGLFGAGSAAFGTRFRRYSLASAAVVMVSGALTSVQAAKIPTGEPTPRMGLYERASVAAWLLWMGVLATKLLRQPHI